jgi:hypothetical protein
VERGFPIVVSGDGEQRRVAVRPQRNPRPGTVTSGATGRTPVAPPIPAPCRRVQFAGPDGTMQLAVTSCTPVNGLVLDTEAL